MKRIFLLSGEDLELAKAEVLALADRSNKDCQMVDNVLILEADFDFRRLALTRKVYDYLFESNYKDLDKTMEDFDWNSVYDKSFSLRITNVGNFAFHETEARLARHIWKKVQSPRVDLDFSQTKIEVIVTEKKIFVARLNTELKHEFHKRRPQTRPERHPTTINPKLARAMVNLTGVPVGKVIYDPFCGTGGILIEAGLMRFKTFGMDIDSDMLEKARKNLEYFKIKHFHLEQGDATKISNLVDYVVTDLPYGRSSKISHDLTDLYARFLTTLENILRYKAVIIFPNFFDHRALLKRTNFKVEKEFTWYVHKSLSRNIVLLSKKR
ncbi:TPA: methyltransferase domain-containing protein [Candidatus Woesearchaeota archaeon]|nr:methyltransferase domain-containing protein [Candidatus Woesearchaeota archaeon]